MEPRTFLYALVGVAIAGALALEKRLTKLPLSLPILFVALGWLVFSLPLDLGWLNPAFDAKLATVAEYATELIVIVSLVGVGLAIDRKFSWKNWKQVAPLLWFTMPVCIAGVAWMGWAWLGLAPAGALLLGACLAPTDPVLARAVQVGPPGESGRDDVRFNLSAEAGFNDSLAFPFVYLAIALSTQTLDGELFAQWFGFDVLWRIAAGCGAGWLTGKAASWFVFSGSDKEEQFFEGREGLLVVGSAWGGFPTRPAAGRRCARDAWIRPTLAIPLGRRIPWHPRSGIDLLSFLRTGERGVRGAEHTVVCGGFRDPALDCSPRSHRSRIAPLPDRTWTGNKGGSVM